VLNAWCRLNLPITVFSERRWAHEYARGSEQELVGWRLVVGSQLTMKQKIDFPFPLSFIWISTFTGMRRKKQPTTSSMHPGRPIARGDLAAGADMTAAYVARADRLSFVEFRDFGKQPRESDNLYVRATADLLLDIDQIAHTKRTVDGDGPMLPFSPFWEGTPMPWSLAFVSSTKLSALRTGFHYGAIS